VESGNLAGDAGSRIGRPRGMCDHRPSGLVRGTACVRRNRPHL